MPQQADAKKMPLDKFGRHNFNKKISSQVKKQSTLANLIAINGAIDFAGRRLINIKTPQTYTDAVTKYYVDSQFKNQDKKLEQLDKHLQQSLERIQAFVHTSSDNIKEELEKKIGADLENFMNTLTFPEIVRNIPPPPPAT